MTLVVIAGVGNTNEHYVAGCPYDYLEINDGSSIQRYCGSSIPGPVNSTNTNITVKFRSDGNSGTATGFLATVCCSVNITTDVAGECILNC